MASGAHGEAAPAARSGGFTRRGLGLLGAAVVAGGVLLGMLLPLGAGGPGGVPALSATPIAPPREAPAIVGRDVDGVPVSVPAEGRPAVVTFVAAACAGACAERVAGLAAGLERAGDDLREVDVVAVSLAPEADGAGAVNDLLARYDLQGRLNYVVGSRAELEPVWRAWGVTVAGPGERVDAGLAPPLVLVDDEGRQVGVYGPAEALDPVDLAADLEVLR